MSFFHDKPDPMHARNGGPMRATEELIRRLLLKVDLAFHFSASEALEAQRYVQDNAFRFLEQAKFDSDAAHRRLWDTLCWRQQQQHVLSFAWEGDSLAFFHKQDLLGRPLLVVRLAFFPTLSCFVDLIPIYACRVMEEARQKLACSLSNDDSTVYRQLSVIVDFCGAPFLPIDATFLKAHLVDLIDQKFPGSIGAVYIINFGWTYQGLWQKLAYLLDDEARNRVSFPSSNELIEMIPKESLLREFGGEDDIPTPMGSVNIEHLLFALEQDQSIRRHEEEKATEDAEVFEMGEQPEVAVAETKNGGRNTTDSFVIQACNTDIKIEKQEVCRSDAEVTRDSLEPTILMAAYEENTENDTTERFLEMTAVENSTSTLHTQIGYAQPMEDNGYEEPECVDHNETEAEKTTNTIFVLSPISKQSSRASSITSNDEGDAILGALESLDGTPSTATPTPASSLPSPTSPMHFLLPHCKDVVSMHPVKRHANPHYLLGIHTCTTHFLKPFLRTSLWSHRRCPSWSTVVMGIESVLLANRLALLEKQETQQCEEVDDHMISKEAVQKSERAGDEENCDLLTSDGIHARHWVRSASPQFAGRLSPASIPRASSGVGTSGCFLIQRLVRCARGLFKATVVHKSAAYCAMFYLLMSRQLSQLFRLLAGSRTHTQLYQ